MVACRTEDIIFGHELCMNFTRGGHTICELIYIHAQRERGADSSCRRSCAALFQKHLSCSKRNRSLEEEDRHRRAWRWRHDGVNVKLTFTSKIGSEMTEQQSGAAAAAAA